MFLYQKDDVVGTRKGDFSSRMGKRAARQIISVRKTARVLYASLPKLGKQGEALRPYAKVARATI